MEEVLLYLVLKYKGNWMTIYEALQHREDVDANEVINATSNTPYKWVPLIAEDYPENFKREYKPPFGLLYYGEIETIKNEKLITVIGTPTQDDYKKLNRLYEDGWNFVWYNVSTDLRKEIINHFPEGNVFYANSLSVFGYKPNKGAEVNAYISDRYDGEEKEYGPHVYLGLSRRYYLCKSASLNKNEARFIENENINEYKVEE